MKFFSWLTRQLNFSPVSAKAPPDYTPRVKHASWLPIRAGAVLGVAPCNGDIVIACEGGVWLLRRDYVDMQFVIERVL